MAAQGTCEPERDIKVVWCEIALEVVGSLDVIDILAPVAAEVEIDAFAADAQLCAIRHHLDELGRGLLANAEQLNGVQEY